MADVRLLPCPFCGVEPYTALYYICCANADCPSVARANTPAAWNTRTAPALTPKQAAADEMFDALKVLTADCLRWVGTDSFPQLCRPHKAAHALAVAALAKAGKP